MILTAIAHLMLVHSSIQKRSARFTYNQFGSSRVVRSARVRRSFSLTMKDGEPAPAIFCKAWYRLSKCWAGTFRKNQKRDWKNAFQRRCPSGRRYSDGPDFNPVAKQLLYQYFRFRTFSAPALTFWPRPAILSGEINSLSGSITTGIRIPPFWAL